MTHCIRREICDEADAGSECDECTERCTQRTRRRECWCQRRSPQTRREPRLEIRRRLDGWKTSHQHQTATHDHVMMRATRTLSHMLPHLGFLERGASQID